MSWFRDAMFLEDMDEHLPEFLPSGVYRDAGNQACKYFVNSCCALKDIIFSSSNNKPCYCDNYEPDSHC